MGSRLDKDESDNARLTVGPTRHRRHGTGSVDPRSPRRPSRSAGHDFMAAQAGIAVAGVPGAASTGASARAERATAFLTIGRTHQQVSRSGKPGWKPAFKTGVSTLPGDRGSQIVRSLFQGAQLSSNSPRRRVEAEQVGSDPTRCAPETRTFQARAAEQRVKVWIRDLWGGPGSRPASVKAVRGGVAGRTPREAASPEVARSGGRARHGSSLNEAGAGAVVPSGPGLVVVERVARSVIAASRSASGSSRPPRDGTSSILRTVRRRGGWIS